MPFDHASRTTDRWSAPPPTGAGLAGCDPRHYVVFGAPLAGTPDPLGAYPELDLYGAVRLLPGERPLGRWNATAASAVRRTPGSAFVDASRNWGGPRGPVVTVTDRRIVLHGSQHGFRAHIPFERLARVRGALRRRAGRITLDLLLHCPRSGATGELTVTLVLAPRRAVSLVRAIARAHRARWSACALPAPASRAVATARLRRLPRELRYDAPVFVPLGLTDAIRGPGAAADVPQRMRTSWRDAPQAAWAGA